MGIMNQQTKTLCNVEASLQTIDGIAGGGRRGGGGMGITSSIIDREWYNKIVRTRTFSDMNKSL